MDQQAEGMLEHLNRLGIAQGLAMQPCQIVSQTSIFAFDRKIAWATLAVSVGTGYKVWGCSDMGKAPDINATLSSYAIFSEQSLY